MMKKLHTGQALTYFLCLMAFSLCGLMPTVSAQDRYVIEYDDGKVVGGSRIKELNSSHKNPSLDGKQPFFRNDRRTTHFRNTQLTRQIKAPYIVFFNGDLLPGTPVSYQRTHGLMNGTARLNIRPLYGVEQAHGPLLAVRPEKIMYMVMEDSPTMIQYSPGRVILKNGQRLTADAIRWTPEGLNILIGEEIQSYTWDQIAQYHAPRDQRIESILALNRRASARNAFLQTYEFENTTRITTVRHDYLIRKLGNHYKLMLTPTWSLSTLYVPEDKIANITYRLPNEIPLSLLPYHTVDQRATTGAHWPWQLNRAVTGQPLLSGQYHAALGIGMHAFTRIRFTLPPHSLRFNGRVGLDESVANGGQAKAQIDINGFQRAYSSPVLIGNVTTHQIKNLDLKKSSTLDLVAHPLSDLTESGDPLDIRDHVNWMNPMISVDTKQLTLTQEDFISNMPDLAQWKADFKAGFHAPSARLRWLSHDNRHYRWTSEYKIPKEGVQFSRSVKIRPEAGFFALAFSRTEQDVTYALSVKAINESGEVLEQSEFSMKSSGRNRVEFLRIPVSAWIGQRVQFVITVASPYSQKDLEKRKAYFRIHALGFQSWLVSQYGNTTAYEPDVALKDAPELRLKTNAKKLAVKDLSASKERLLVLGHRRLTEGLIFQDYIEFQCKIPENSQSFVMTLGTVNTDYHDYVTIKIDGRDLWRARVPLNDANGPTQIKLDLPPGAKSLQLISKSRGKTQFGVYKAGFVKTDE